MDRDRALDAELPGSADRQAWSRPGRRMLLAVLALWTLWIWKDASLAGGSAGSTFLHLVLLPFHEAGHYAIFRWFGNFVMTLGGTLGQHLMPIVCGIALWRRGDRFGTAVCAWLLAFSVVDMAVYMYDAFDPQLPLLDGRTGAESDGHDWQNLFGDMGLLKRARGIGRFFDVLGFAGMAAALAWAWIASAKPAPTEDDAD
jgi:hypothetical protein